MLNAPVVALRGVVKDYKGLRPLRVQSLEIGSGEVVTVSGLDRAAAAVLTDLLTGTTVPDSGEVVVAGLDTRAIADHDAWLAFLDRFGLVNERVVLLDALTVAQNLAVPLTLDLDPLPVEVRARVERLAADVGIPGDLLDRSEPLRDAAIKARVRLGRAIALDPRLLVVEHPTVDLPKNEGRRLGRVIGELAELRGLAVLVVSSDEAFCDASGSRRLTWRASDGTTSEVRGWTRLFSRS